MGKALLRWLDHSNVGLESLIQVYSYYLKGSQASGREILTVSKALHVRSLQEFILSVQPGRNSLGQWGREEMRTSQVLMWIGIMGQHTSAVAVCYLAAPRQADVPYCCKEAAPSRDMREAVVHRALCLLSKHPQKGNKAWWASSEKLDLVKTQIHLALPRMVRKKSLSVVVSGCLKSSRVNFPE